MVDASQSSYGLKGDEFMQKGDKKYQGSFFGKMFGSKEERMEKAIACYQ